MTTAGNVEPVNREPVQNEPVQDGTDDATREQKMSGLLEQISADMTGRPRVDVIAEIVLRFGASGIDVDEAEIETLADSVTNGEAGR